MLNFHDFGHIYATAGAYNLANVSFNEFADKISDLFSNPIRNSAYSERFKLSNKVRTIVDSHYIRVIGNEISLPEEITSGFESYSEELKLISESNIDREYKPKFRPMYLIGGLFSFIVLLNSGFSHYYDELYLYQSTFSISIFCLVIYGYIFLTTYFGELSSVSTSFSLIAMLVVIGFSYFPIISFENCNCIVFTSLFITLGPLLLHTIRITGSMFILFKRIRKLNKEYSSKLDKQINSIDTVLEAQSEIERLQALIDSFKKH